MPCGRIVACSASSTNDNTASLSGGGGVVGVIVGVVVAVRVGVSVIVALGVTVVVIEGTAVGVRLAVDVAAPGVTGGGVGVAVSVGSCATVGSAPTACGVGFPAQAARSKMSKGMNGRIFVMALIIYCLF